MAKLQIIGTSHISPESVRKVEEKILEKKPTMVAIELDRGRFAALLSQKRRTRLSDIRHIGVKGWLFAMIGAWAEKSLGAKVGVSPGTEMLTAAKAAQKVDAKIALIDQDISITLRRLSKEITWKEKWNFFVDVIKGVIFRQGVKIDLAKVPPKELIKKLVRDVKKRYPSIYQVLIVERNEIMAKHLAHLLLTHPESYIIAVIGAGHEDEVRELVKRYIKQQKKIEAEKRDELPQLQKQN